MSTRIALLLKNPEGDQERCDAIKNALKKYCYTVNHFSKTVEAIESFDKQKPTLVVASLGTSNLDMWIELIEHIRQNRQENNLFICIYSTTASEKAKVREACFKRNVNMVTNNLQALEKLMEQLVTIEQLNMDKTQKIKNLQCPFCKSSTFNEDSLWHHMPLYHINENIDPVQCPLCKQQVDDIHGHYRNMHGPCSKGIIESEYHKSTSLYAFSLVVVRRETDGKYLVVQERNDSGYWLPGGRVDPGEQLDAAAIRECKEEAGVDIKLTGVLSIQFVHHKTHARMRVIYLATPIDQNQPPKSLPDYESCGASYVSLQDLKDVKLRGSEPLTWFSYLENGGIVHPLSVLTREK